MTRTLVRLAAVGLAGLALLAPAAAQTQLSEGQLVQSLLETDQIPVIDIEALRRRAVDNVAQNRTPEPGVPLSAELARLSQFTFDIHFDLNSAAIEPQSFRLVGAMADALRYPTLLEHKFLVIGHTDATGTRQKNLELSQRRADAIKDALVTTFGINPARVYAIGLGEEQLLNPAKPDDPANRRVQLINIGRYRS
jgi:outer membrane protein OmpA-like peptidoglycan-associated protein